MGNSDTNTVKFDDGTGLQLNGAAGSCTLGLNDVLILRYNTNTSTWNEIRGQTIKLMNLTYTTHQQTIELESYNEPVVIWFLEANWWLQTH